MVKLLVFLAFASVLVLSASEAKNVVCYFTSWTIYRPDNGKFKASDVDPNLCTHILYAFVGLREDGSVSVLDDWELTGLEEMNHLMSLKQQNSNLKIILSMGGWNEGSYKYSEVAKNPARRAAMVQSVLEFIDKYGFDGFDLDWEYPCQRGGADEDKENFVVLLGELKGALNAKGLILSAAVSGGVASCELSYDIPRVSQNLDMINVMVYDFHGAFEPFVGHYAPLYASHLDQTDVQKTLNVAAGIEYWLNQGADASKINLGLGTYGRTFALADPKNTSLYAGTYGGGDAGPYTRQMGVIGYNEVCELHSTWEYVWDDEQKVPHIINGNQWFGYDDAKSLQLKVEFANSKNLGGVMIWSLDTDDFKGICGNGPYPLLHAINNALAKLKCLNYSSFWPLYGFWFTVSSTLKDPNLCTHVLYAFVGLNEDGTVRVLDDWEINGLKEVAHLMSLKNQNPNLKIIVSMGGWNEGSYKYSEVAKNAAKRVVMVDSVLSFINKYGFDGFDLVWEYPCQRGGANEDKENFIVLLGELKSALNDKGMTLSAAVSGGIASCDLSYDIPRVSQNLDMINVMVYDFHGAFEPFVGHYAPLYASHLDQTDVEKTLNVAAGIEYWLNKGADPSKMNLGLGTYGRTFTLADPKNTSLYAPVYGGGNAGPYTRQIGVIGYNEVCEFYSTWEYVWDDEQKVPHIINDNQWFGYDDAKSLQLKFANSKNLGGVMIWSLDTDDFHGICGNGSYPLLHAINSALGR